MRKKPDKLYPAGAAVFDGPEDKPGVMVFEIRLKLDDKRGGKFLWFSGIDEDFAEMLEGETIEFRQKMFERMLYMTEQTLSKALGLTPQ